MLINVNVSLLSRLLMLIYKYYTDDKCKKTAVYTRVNGE